MLPREMISSRLVEPGAKRPVEIKPVLRPSRWRMLYVVYQLLALGVVTHALRLCRRLTPEAFAARVREFFGRLGPLWIQAGKFLAMRSDLMPPEYARELAHLRDSAAGFAFDEARAIVEQEWGGPIERHFDEFNPAPFAAGSNFQLHRAKLRRAQVWVAVKVQRPFTEQVVAQDLAAIRTVMKCLDRLKLWHKMRWLDLYSEIEEQLTREVDFRFEASTLRELKKSLPDHGIYVPDVFLELCTKRVLVMEYISGVLLSDYLKVREREPERILRWHEENGVDPRQVARRLFFSVWRQILEDNYFHADMHTGNVILLRNNQLAIIDCRAVGFLELEQQRKLKMYYKALAHAEFSTAAEHSFLLAQRLPVVPLGEVKAAFIRVWRRWESRNYVRDLSPAEKSLTQMLDELNRIMRQYGFELQWSMARMAWAVVNADASILPLSASINYLKWLTEYFRQADQRASQLEPEQLALSQLKMAQALQELPRALIDSSVAQQEIVRRQAQVVEGSTYKSTEFFAFVTQVTGLTLLLSAGFALLTLGVKHNAWLGHDRAKWVAGRAIYELCRGAPLWNETIWTSVVIVAGLAGAWALLSSGRGRSQIDTPPESRVRA